MGERNLSRHLATQIVEALKKAEHVLVVKGGSEALARDLDELLGEHLPLILARMAPRAVVGEVTSTFGDEAVDEAVEAMVGAVAGALMDSDHVEDVFAEDNVIRRDVFRVVRDALLSSAAEPDEDEEPAGPISVRLGTLGYVASTVAKLADSETLHDALERAALASEGELTAYDPAGPEATFRLTDDDPDARLELEEAVAEELESLVEMGLVDLPTIERRVTLLRDVMPAERAELRGKISAMAARTLAGCAGTWAIEGARTLRLTFTPLSEQDTLAADDRTARFGHDVNAMLADIDAAAAAEGPKTPAAKGPEAAPAPAEPAQAATKEAPKAAAKARPAKAEDAEAPVEKPAKKAAVEKPAKKAAAKAAPGAAAKKTAAKKAVKKKA